MFTKNTSLIIPTRNRPLFLKNTFANLGNMAKTFKEILVIDSSDAKIKEEVCQIAKKNNARYFHTKASSSHQRNFGLHKKNYYKYTMFLDDDLQLVSKSFHEMNIAIERKSKIYDAYGFNLTSKKKSSFFEKLKNTKIFKVLSLYSNHPGEVLSSGWHTKIVNLKKNTPVSWVYIGATVFRSNKISKILFDNYLGKYSYLEDLDFSLQLTKNKKKILIVANAKFEDPNYINRDGIRFGLLEIKNRFRIVEKHNFNKKNFFLLSFLRFFLSFILSLKGNPAMFCRGVGNLCGIIMCLLKLIK